jgi:hypothetical protein
MRPKVPPVRKLVNASLPSTLLSDEKFDTWIDPDLSFRIYKSLTDTEFKQGIDPVDTAVLRQFLQRNPNLELQPPDPLTVQGHKHFQLVLPKQYHITALEGVHNEVGHLGTDHSLQLLRDRYFWPNMSSSVQHHISRCNPCILRKVPPNTRAPLVSVVTSQPLELLCMDFLSLEPSKGAIENILVITDHFTKYAITIPCKNQSAKTTAKALFHKFIEHYGFPHRLHSDQGI